MGVHVPIFYLTLLKCTCRYREVIIVSGVAESVSVKWNVCMLGIMTEHAYMLICLLPESLHAALKHVGRPAYTEKDVGHTHFGCGRHLYSTLGMSIV